MQNQQNRHKLTKSYASRIAKAFMKSYKFHLPNYDLPLRIRPWFLVLTCAIMVLLAFLGFTNFSRSLPLNDKLLHFLCFCLATGVFYFIMDVEESARRVWFWRFFGLIFTFFTCFLCGGIVSEVVQSLLPYKEFQIGDVVANILGSSLGLFVSYHFEKYYRHRREISRLYQPLGNDSLSDFEDDLESLGTQLLPTHHTNRPPIGVGGGGKSKGARKKGRVRFADVWDEREEAFEIGEESEDESEGLPLHREANGQGQEQPRQAVLSNL